MKNKGFTLIELLAVIVILAIIALIATPIILGIIDDARKSSSERGAELVISSVDLAYSSAYMLNDGNVPTLAQVASGFDMDGATMDANGNITTADKGIVCTTTNTDNVLKVSCEANGKVKETKTNMILSTGTTNPGTVTE